MLHLLPQERLHGDSLGRKRQRKGEEGAPSVLQCKLSQPVTAAYKEVCATASAPLQRQLQGALSLQSKEVPCLVQEVPEDRLQQGTGYRPVEAKGHGNKALEALPPRVGL